jgi:broad specificity phosphatase PhoE
MIVRLVRHSNPGCLFANFHLVMEKHVSRTDGVKPEHLSEHFGNATAELVNDVFAEGADRAVLLMRHSARTFDSSIHDLHNPLTDHGRDLCAKLGQKLPKHLTIKGYASPPERCVETAEKTIAAHTENGGTGGRTRPVEALGVFYCLDQQKMWKVLRTCDGLADFVGRWFEQKMPVDALMPPELAVQMIMRVLQAKLEALNTNHLDLCVTHDMTVFTMRHGMGLEPAHGPDVEFLDGLVLFEKDGRRLFRSHHGGEVDVSEALNKLQTAH